MVSLVSYIREGVRRHLNQKQAVMLTEFDKLKRDYQEHQHEIHAKLIAIMSDRLHVHSRTLESIRWEEPPPQEGAPNPYMESLVKEHTTLHKVLSRFLHAETVMHIMTQVFAALDAKLAEQFGKVELKSQRAQERMLVDVRYLSEKLGSLKGLENIGPGKVSFVCISATIRLCSLAECADSGNPRREQERPATRSVLAQDRSAVAEHAIFADHSAFTKDQPADAIFLAPELQGSAAVSRSIPSLWGLETRFGKSRSAGSGARRARDGSISVGAAGKRRKPRRLVRTSED